jgi:hypothetical protein
MRPGRRLVPSAVTEAPTDGRSPAARSGGPLHDDAVECLICRDEDVPARLFNTLSKHLSKHGMTVRDYRHRYPGARTASRDVRGYQHDLLLDRRPITGDRFWTDDQVIAVLRADAKRRGRSPTQEEWKRPSKGRPSFSTLRHHFGSFNAALRAAQLPTRKTAGQLGVRRSHCLRGHELTPENTITKPDGQRQCRTCANAGLRRRRKERTSGVGATM